jgi:hypothetical protein
MSTARLFQAYFAAKILVSRFVAENRPAFRSLWRESGMGDPSSRSTMNTTAPLASPPDWILARIDVRTTLSKKFNGRNRRPMSNDAKLEQRHNHLSNETSHLKMSAAAVDDESCQDNEKHNCGGDRSPVIFAPPWVGPPAVVAAGRTASIFKVWVYHFRVPR